MCIIHKVQFNKSSVMKTARGRKAGMTGGGGVGGALVVVLCTLLELGEWSMRHACRGFELMTARKLQKNAHWASVL
jgi:hypothetical protein